MLSSYGPALEHVTNNGNCLSGNIGFLHLTAWIGRCDQLIAFQSDHFTLCYSADQVLFWMIKFGSSHIRLKCNSNPLMCNAIYNVVWWAYMCWHSGAVSGEDGKSRADQLQHLLKNLDQYVASSVDYQRQRACYTVLALLKQFRALCMSGSCPFNCAGNCMHLRSTAERVQSSSAGTCEHVDILRCESLMAWCCWLLGEMFCLCMVFSVILCRISIY